jgi:CubicO group peptidase (beta-lactamase class C family)
MKPRLTLVAMMSLWLLPAALASADPIDDAVRPGPAGPGVALLVMQNGTIVKQQGYGYANVELRVPVTADTLFELASVTKMFTAAGVLLLAQDGKLRLDDPPAKYLPDAPAAWSRVTIRQLLTHTSGLRDYASLDLDWHKHCGEDGFRALLREQPIEFDPGTQWGYSSTGYDILGLLIMQLTGESWSDFLAGRLFAPLGMRPGPDDQRTLANRATGYVLDPRTHQLVNQEANQDRSCPIWPPAASGGLRSSLRDLARWEQALDARAFMSEPSFTDWWTPVRLTNGMRHPYGFGWFLSEQRGQPVLFHTGHSGGFSAEIARYPEQRLAVAYLTNVASVNTEAMVRTVAGLADQRLKLPSVTRRETAADPALTSSLRAVLEAWAASRTTPGMSPSLAATATNSERESFDRHAVGRQLRSAHSLRVTGTDRLSARAVSLLADGSVTAVDAVLETDGNPVPLHFRLDSKNRVVSFTHY